MDVLHNGEPILLSPNKSSKFSHGQECKLVSCHSCGMFKLFNSIDYQNIHKHLNNGYVYNCDSCLQILDLNVTINNLRDRITYLESVRDLEDAIDNSYSTNVMGGTMTDLTQQLANLTLSNVNEPRNNVTPVCHSESDHSIQIPDSSIMFGHGYQNEGMESIFDISNDRDLILTTEEAHDVVPTGKEDCVINNLVENTGALTTSLTRNATSSTVNLNENPPNVHANSDSITTLELFNTNNDSSDNHSNSKLINISQNSLPGMVFDNGNIDTKAEANTFHPHRTFDPLSKYGKENNVKILIIGDSTFAKLLLNSKLMRADEYFKIAKPGATISDSINNALYFIHHLFSGIKNVILQVSLADTCSGKSEKVTSELQKFILLMNELNIKVVVCGPIPFNCMTNESFSRAYAINMQLIKRQRYGPEKFAFIDAFDLMWNDDVPFIMKRHKLSNYGYWLLEEAVSSCVFLTD